MILTWKIPENWPADLVIELMDHQKGIAVSMMDQTEYRFAIEAAKGISKGASAMSLNPLNMPSALMQLTGFQSGIKGPENVATPFSILIHKGARREKPVYEKLEAVLLPPAPNPFRQHAKLSFRLPEKADVRIEVFNLYGRLLDVPVTGEYPAGLNEITWTPETHFTGVCLIRFTSGNIIKTQKAVRLTD
jgi:hypothetical protein